MVLRVAEQGVLSLIPVLLSTSTPVVPVLYRGVWLLAYID